MNLQSYKNHLFSNIQVVAPSSTTAERTTKKSSFFDKPNSVQVKRNKSPDISALDMIKTGRYNTYNLLDPEHGMKYYDPNDPNMHQPCLYRSDRIAIGKNEKTLFYTD